GRAADERWHLRKNGRRFFVSGVVTPIRDDTGALRGFAKVARDITDRREMEEELRRRAEALSEASRAKDEFLAMLAHELRNPLAALTSALQVLRMSGPEQSAWGRSMEVVRRQVHHQSRLVDDLLDVSRITQGKVALRRERVDLGQIVRDT